MDYLKNLRDAVQRKYSCDRSSSIHKLEDLIQESMVGRLRILRESLLRLPVVDHSKMKRVNLKVMMDSLRPIFKGN